MNREDHYSAAHLESSTVEEIKNFEEQLSKKINKDVVVIAYEKEE